MSVRMTLGALSVEVDHPEAADAMLRGLLKHLTCQEVAALLGVTERTVRRWQRKGHLPCRAGGRTLLLDLLTHLGPGQPTPLTTEALESTRTD